MADELTMNQAMKLAGDDNVPLEMRLACDPEICVYKVQREVNRADPICRRAACDGYQRLGAQCKEYTPQGEIYGMSETNERPE